MNGGAPHIYLRWKVTSWGSGWAEHDVCLGPDRMHVGGVLYFFFALEDRLH
jgi:hypothetical protein